MVAASFTLQVEVIVSVVGNIVGTVLVNEQGFLTDAPRILAGGPSPLRQARPGGTVVISRVGTVTRHQAIVIGNQAAVRTA